MCEHAASCDARALHIGSYSAWLTKVKGEHAKARFVSTSCKRFYTIDFDAQLFYYSHTADRKKISNPVKFKEIQTVEQLPRPAQTAKHSNDFTFGFTVKTPGRFYELYTITYLDARHWVEGLTAARDIANGPNWKELQLEAKTAFKHGTFVESMSSQSTIADGSSDSGRSSDPDFSRFGGYTAGVAGPSPARGPQHRSLQTNQNGGYAAQGSVNPPPVAPTFSGGYGGGPSTTSAGHGVAQTNTNDFAVRTPVCSVTVKSQGCSGVATSIPTTVPIGWAESTEPQAVDPFAALDALEELAGPPPPEAAPLRTNAMPQQTVQSALLREARAIVTNKGKKPSAEATEALQQLKSNPKMCDNSWVSSPTAAAPAASAPKPMQAFVAPAQGPVLQQAQQSATIHAMTHHNPSAETWDSDDDESPTKRLIEAPAPAPLAPTPLSSAPMPTPAKPATAWTTTENAPTTEIPRKLSPAPFEASTADSAGRANNDASLELAVGPPLHHQHATAAQVDGLEDSGWDSDGDRKIHAHTKATSTASHKKLRQDVCGAPMQPSDTFVAAKPRPAATNCNKLGSGDDDLDDLVGEVLAASTPFPSRQSGASHSLVPGFQCTSCDFQVLRVENHIWGSGAEYMFFRNNYPNVQKMRSQLVPRKECCAYCCQCSWKSAESAAPLEDVAAGLRWRSIGL